MYKDVGPDARKLMEQMPEFGKCELGVVNGKVRRLEWVVTDANTVVLKFTHPEDVDVYVAQLERPVKGERLLTKRQRNDIVEPALAMGAQLRRRYEPRIAAQHAEVQRLEAQLAAVQARERELRIANREKCELAQRIINASRDPDEIEALQAAQRRLVY